MLTRLIYTSKARRFSSTDIAGILAVSRSWNATVGITGALCLLDGVYMQYLEGEQADVEDLYGKIKVDERHHDPVVLERGEADVRVFPDWTMALLVWDERIKAIVRRHGVGPSESLYDIAPAEAVPFFLSLARTPNWVAL